MYSAITSLNLRARVEYCKAERGEEGEGWRERKGRERGNGEEERERDEEVVSLLKTKFQIQDHRHDITWAFLIRKSAVFLFGPCSSCAISSFRPNGDKKWLHIVVTC